MSDSSSITGAINPAGLPEKFTFNISHEEAIRVFAMAKRYAPEIPMGYRFQLQFGETQFGEHTRRWVMREQNITGFFADYNTTGPSLDTSRSRTTSLSTSLTCLTVWSTPW